MKKNNKGFTLIELLAVIIILAIIALIAVPTVMSIINESKAGAAKDSAYGVISAAETYYATELMKGTTLETATIADLNLKGKAPSEGGTATVTYEDGKVSFELTFNGYKCIATASEIPADCTAAS